VAEPAITESLVIMGPRRRGDDRILELAPVPAFTRMNGDWTNGGANLKFIPPYGAAVHIAMDTVASGWHVLTALAAFSARARLA
jgi:hypothetical protein